MKKDRRKAKALKWANNKLFQKGYCPSVKRSPAIVGKLISDELSKETGKPILTMNVVELYAQYGVVSANVKRRDARRDFYQSPEWRKVRYSALLKSDGKCCLCGASKKNGKVLHVDHIKPRSRYPHLQFELSNLQVLCEDCNLGKSNLDCTDWRNK